MREKLKEIDDRSKCSIIQLVAIVEGEKRENGGDRNNRKGYRVKFSRVKKRQISSN